MPRQVVKDQKLCLPVALVREWQHHPHCGKDFTAWMEDFLKEKNHQLVDPEKETEPSAAKRPPGDAQSGPSPKKPKLESTLDPKFLVPIGDIKDTLIQEINLGKDWPAIHLREGDHSYLVNASDKAWSHTDPCIALFGAGSWKILKEKGSDRALQFVLSNQDDMVFMDNVCQPLSKVLAAMRAKKPDCKVCYHTLDETSSSAAFSLTSTHNVFFVGKADETALGKHNVGWALLKNLGPALRVVWHVRWTTKGLSPIKPSIHFVGPITVPEQNAVQLHP